MTSISTLLDDVVAFPLRRDGITVSGPDAGRFLQGQLTQEIEGIARGSSVWSFALQPQGKIDVFLRATRRDHDTFLLDIDHGYGDALFDRLKRYCLRVKVTFTQYSLDGIALRGQKYARVLADFPHDVDVLQCHWRGIHGIDIFDSDLVDKVQNNLRDIPKFDIESRETLRIVNGLPAMGAEINDQVIPGEVGANDLTISMTKGCYTGQELVARIDARGNTVPRYLRCVTIEGDAEPPCGAHVIDPATAHRVHNKPLGVLTSIAKNPSGSGWVALAFIRRATFPPYDALVDWDDGPSQCRIHALPIEFGVLQ